MNNSTCNPLDDAATNLACGVESKSPMKSKRYMKRKVPPLPPLSMTVQLAPKGKKDRPKKRCRLFSPKKQGL